MESLGEIIVLPFFGQGHLNPCLELCKQFGALNLRAILIIPSTLTSSVSNDHPLVEVVELPNSSPPPETADVTDSESKPGNGAGSNPPLNRLSDPMAQGIDHFLTERYGSGQVRPICAVVDVMMRWSVDIFAKLNIPIASFFTSGACHSAIEYAKWKVDADSIKPGEVRFLPGLPDNMALSYADVNIYQRKKGGNEADANEPGAGRRTPWWENVEGSTVLLFNTCDDLEGVIIKYIADQTGKPVYGVGPLLPEQYWKSAGSLVHDHEVRSNEATGIEEDDVMKWLNSKPEQSVIYISFGTEVTPTCQELAEVASALEESNQAFIWVIPPGSGISGPPKSIKTMMGKEDEGGFEPYGLEEKVGNRGLIIKGWAPQLLILSHPSVGGFLSHCGWNSTVEAVGRGVPILAWPIGGDQFNNAKLIVNHLGVGHTLDDPSETMNKEWIIKGIEMMMGDQQLHNNSKELAHKFQAGYPSLKAFIRLLTKSPLQREP
ncbi:glycosyltransferase [Lithospermum erythrorhizon]|uniref:Glycosyltransferase n=1 Tax=Lithospermum erythrorhizon TaxID=34254 RepID=A0AAV3NIP2_LITER